LFFFLPHDLIKNPPKTVPAARAEATIVLSGGRRMTKAITNTIADAKTANGIQYVTALDGLSDPDSMPVNDYRLVNPRSNIS
jgi:hypothetical protein